MPATSSPKTEVAEGILKARGLLQAIASEDEVPIQVHEPRDDIFFDVTIEGVRFQSFVSDDPYIIRKDNEQWCQLGVASIQQAKEWRAPADAGPWMVCKYSAMEGRIDLSPLSEAGRRTLAVIFGIPIPQAYPGVASLYDFYASRSFDGLVAWAVRRPRKFKAAAGVSSYLGDWKSIVNQRLAESKQQT